MRTHGDRALGCFSDAAARTQRHEGRKVSMPACSRDGRVNSRSARRGKINPRPRTPAACMPTDDAFAAVGGQNSRRSESAGPTRVGFPPAVAAAHIRKHENARKIPIQDRRSRRFVKNVVLKRPGGQRSRPSPRAEAKKRDLDRVGRGRSRCTVVSSSPV